MPIAGSRKFVEQRFRFLEVGRVEAFGEAKQLVDASTGLSNFAHQPGSVDSPKTTLVSLAAVAERAQPLQRTAPSRRCASMCRTSTRAFCR